MSILWDTLAYRIKQKGFIEIYKVFYDLALEPYFPIFSMGPHSHSLFWPPSPACSSN